jgi:hypothetical protein
VQSARAAARRTQCLNNIKQLCLAMENNATKRNGAYPPVRDISVGTQAALARSIWPIEILDALDNEGTKREIRDSGVFDLDFRLTSPVAALKVFICPDDQANSVGDYGLSYKVNGGIYDSMIAPYDPDLNPTGIDMTLNAAVAVAFDPMNPKRAEGRSTGVFFENTANGGSVSKDFVGQGDGNSNTIMIAENLLPGMGSQGMTPASVDHGKWNNYQLDSLRFAIDVNQVLGGSGNRLVPTTNTAFMNQTLIDIKPTSSIATLGNSALNANAAGPHPKSAHSDIVIMGFCDGGGRQILESIDRNVYFKLVTSNGQKLGEGTYDGKAF